LCGETRAVRIHHIAANSRQESQKIIRKATSAGKVDHRSKAALTTLRVGVLLRYTVELWTPRRLPVFGNDEPRAEVINTDSSRNDKAAP
jgi:hypothetical protein